MTCFRDPEPLSSSKGGPMPSSDANRIYYEALLNRDKSFDGLVFIGVRTTGIYCRTICPARKAMFKNCNFYRSSAQAELNGFRPCKRCRPDAIPHSPAWIGTQATVNRAMRLIDQGALDETSVDALADKLGVSSRHLRRLFEEHLGASPQQIAQTKRLHKARQLLRQSQLPIIEIALNAGFGSVRRFNHCFKDQYGMSPSHWRKERRAAGEKLVEPIGIEPTTSTLRTWRSPN